ncbi:hypothetical protein [Halomonas heilongjiangensis]|uniref:Uncharacterized protein n=1 Tax=Halomonas heilongjiangensis TaxID=1387883 RepID=A0A2N7TFC0_9GAMM|nr:hypothetical protein [Halomonas heilongjiangensis]PMR66878.1 hypothetical protein C1H66_22245 [Halomonas heilongjiangensis]PXX91256.1 hypothetical protein CR158_06970 [Halomonas heilongjiangensis]
MTRLVIHIDKLVLRGIDRSDAAAVAAGVQAELQRLLAEPGAASALIEGGDRSRLKAGAIQQAPATGGRALGRAIAGGIVGGTQS